MSMFDYPDPGQDPEYCDGLGRMGRATSGDAPRFRCMPCDQKLSAAECLAHVALGHDVRNRLNVRQKLSKVRTS